MYYRLYQVHINGYNKCIDAYDKHITGYIKCILTGTYTKHGLGSMDHHGPPHPVHGPPHGPPLIFKRKSPLLI